MRNVSLTAPLLLAWAGLLFAQSSGTINGRVTDPAEATVARATVSWTGLVTLVPGARQAPILDTTKATMGAGIAVGGNEGRNLGLNVDGAENRDLMLGGPAMDYTLEGIQEFKLLAHNFGAQYARSSGGVL